SRQQAIGETRSPVAIAVKGFAGGFFSADREFRCVQDEGEIVRNPRATPHNLLERIAQLAERERMNIAAAVVLRLFQKGFCGLAARRMLMLQKTEQCIGIETDHGS